MEVSDIVQREIGSAMKHYNAGPTTNPERYKIAESFLERQGLLFEKGGYNKAGQDMYRKVNKYM